MLKNVYVYKGKGFNGWGTGGFPYSKSEFFNDKKHFKNEERDQIMIRHLPVARSHIRSQRPDGLFYETPWESNTCDEEASTT